MFKRFTTRELVFIALLTGVAFAVNYAFGSLVAAAFGFPLATSIFTGLTIGIWFVLLYKTVPKFGTFALFGLLYSILEMPTALGGAPGFWPKIPINTLSGVIADLLFVAVKYKKWAIFPGFFLLSVVNLGGFILFLWLLGLPGADKTLALAPILMVVYWILGTISIFLGFAIHNKVKNKQFMRQISG